MRTPSRWRLVSHAGQDVTVAVEGHGNGGMAQEVLYELGMVAARGVASRRCVVGRGGARSSPPIGETEREEYSGSRSCLPGYARSGRVTGVELAAREWARLWALLSAGILAFTAWWLPSNPSTVIYRAAYRSAACFNSSLRKPTREAFSTASSGTFPSSRIR